MTTRNTLGPGLYISSIVFAFENSLTRVTKELVFFYEFKKKTKQVLKEYVMYFRTILSRYYMPKN
jgi:hypothetical protein